MGGRTERRRTEWRRRKRHMRKGVCYVSYVSDDARDDICNVSNDARDDIYNDTAVLANMMLNVVAPLLTPQQWASLHFVYWRVPVWYRESSYSKYKLITRDMIFYEITPCTLQILRQLTYTFQTNAIWCWTDAVILQCSGCCGCCDAYL